MTRFAISFLMLWNIIGYAAPGDTDSSFNPILSGAVKSIQVQADGKILVGGSFTNVNGVSCGGIVRLNADGNLDTNFVVQMGLSNSVFCIAIQPDDGIIIAGTITSVNGTNRNGIARLDADGTLDNSFNPGSGVGGFQPFVKCVAIQTNGQILISGNFFSVNGTNRSGFARLNADGSLDSIFNPAVNGGGNEINAIAPQTDGRLIIAGDFGSVNGTNLNFIARLNADGTLDSTFNPNPVLGQGVGALACQPDGEILIGADDVQAFVGTNYNGVAQLDENGNLNSSFNPGSGPNDQVTSIAIQPDGKILIGGWFTMVNGASRVRIARLNSDGSLDVNFNPSGGLTAPGATFGPSVSTIDIQADGKLLVGGDFTTVNGVGSKYLVRFFGDDPPRFTSITPLVGGTVELFGQAATNAHLCLEVSTNLNDWSSLNQFTNNTGTFHLMDDSVGFSSRFYRIVWLP